MHECRCIANLLASLPAHPPWQMLEVLLFALRSVVAGVRSRMPGARLPDTATGAVRPQPRPPAAPPNPATLPSRVSLHVRHLHMLAAARGAGM